MVLLRKVVLGLALLYTILFVVWRGLLLSPYYDRFWQLRLSEVFNAWAYLPLLLPLALVLLTRQHRALLLLLMPLGCFSYEYGLQYLPKWQAWAGIASPTVTLRVLTWNTHATMDQHDEFIHEVRRLRPDLVALQEASYSLRRKVADELFDEYPYQINDLLSSAESLITLSRYPVSQHNFDRRIGGCRCQQLVIQWRGQSITVINSHVPSPYISLDLFPRIPRVLAFDNKFQYHAVDALLTQVATVQGPLLVMGDLNTTEQQWNLRRLAYYLQDAFSQAGWGLGFTFPVGKRLRYFAVPPFVRIDHILYNAHWQAITAWPGPPLDSDHLYVVADLRLVSDE